MYSANGGNQEVYDNILGVILILVSLYRIFIFLNYMYAYFYWTTKSFVEVEYNRRGLPKCRVLASLNDMFPEFEIFSMTSIKRERAVIRSKIRRRESINAVKVSNVYVCKRGGVSLLPVSYFFVFWLGVEFLKGRFFI